MRERVRIEARSALGAGEAGRADHQTPRSLSIPPTASKRRRTDCYNFFPMRVRLGSERLLESGTLAGRRVGVVCNPASIDGEFRHVADRLAADTRVRLAALFGPQHGFRSDVQENMIETGHGRDEIRRVPVYSLYSETREPTADMLRDLDVLVVDLQDVGTRIYTYIYTMANCLRAARRHGVKVIVCDRPNPIDGIAVEGPMLDPGFESFVGPLSHSDAARDDDRRACAAVQRTFRHRRGPRGRDDGRVAPGDVCGRRPVCPGCCPRRTSRRSTARSCIRAPCCSKARTSRRVGARRARSSWSGAPWIVAERFADAMNRIELPGVHFRPALFEPTFHKHAKTSCGGCQIHVLDRQLFRAVETGVALVSAFRARRATGAASNGGSLPTNTSTRSCRSTSWQGLPSCASRSKRGCRPATSRGRGRPASPDS